MPTETTTIRIYGQGEIFLEDATRTLGAIEAFYNGAYVLQQTLLRAERRIEWGREYGFRNVLGAELFDPYTMGIGVQMTNDLVRLTDPVYVRLLVPLEDRLVLKATRLQSPGFWEVVGSLAPLETLRKFLQDRHERAKDADWRSDAERRGRDLDNSLKASEALGRQIENLRHLGATDADLAPLKNALLEASAQSLGSFQDRRILGGADAAPINAEFEDLGEN